MYGQAEATARMSYLHPENAVEKAGSIGRAIPGGSFWLEDELGRRVEGSELDGELVYQGGNVFMGYAEGYQDLSKADECKGILKTGDLARRDGDGDYYIVGRLKRFLKIFGHRVNLQDVEELISAKGFSVACSGRDDHLDVYLSNGDCAMGRQIKEKLVAELKVAPAAVRILGISEIPRSESGKIQYSLLETLSSQILA
jgi:acyl-coenzyme A synthetase/AMP-(fatty) acid ligase